MNNIQQPSTTMMEITEPSENSTTLHEKEENGKLYNIQRHASMINTTNHQQHSKAREKEDFEKVFQVFEKELLLLQKFNPLKVLDPNGDMVKNIPCIHPKSLLRGYYRCLFYDEEKTKLYILQEDTNWITCVPSSVLSKYGITIVTLIKLNVWPVIRAIRSSHFTLTNIHFRHLTRYKYLDEWRIEKCGPFGTYRLMPIKGTAAEALETQEENLQKDKDIKKQQKLKEKEEKRKEKEKKKQQKLKEKEEKRKEKEVGNKQEQYQNSDLSSDSSDDDDESSESDSDSYSYDSDSDVYYYNNASTLCYEDDDVAPIIKYIKHCEGKLELFPENLDITKFPLWKATPTSYKMYIVGILVVNGDDICFVVIMDSHSMGEYQMCLLQNNTTKDDSYDDDYYDDLLDKIEIFNDKTKVLFGDYVIEITFDGSQKDEWFDKESVKILKLSEAPFYGKKLMYILK